MSYSVYIDMLRERIIEWLPQEIAKIIFEYGDVDKEILTSILSIRAPVFEIRKGMMLGTGWEYNLRIGLSEHGSRRKMFFDMTSLNKHARHVKNRGIFKLQLDDAAKLVKNGDFIGLAQSVRAMMFKSYRRNADKLGYIGTVLELMLIERAKKMLGWRSMRKR